MVSKQTARLASRWRRICAVAVGLSILFWAALPVPPHVTSLFETLQEHRLFMAEHGHAHGFEEDLAAALHGHSHDAVEHDHSVAMLTFPPHPQAPTSLGEGVRPPPDAAISDFVFRIDRPPRA